MATNITLTVGEDPAAHVIVGDVAPSTAPSYITQFYLNKVAKKLYIATGTSSATDWTPLN